MVAIEQPDASWTDSEVILGEDGKDEYGYDYVTRRFMSPYAIRSLTVALIVPGLILVLALVLAR